MFRDEFYFMTRVQTNAWNRVNQAGGCRAPDRKDFDIVDNMMLRVKDWTILRTEEGHIPVIPLN